MDGQKHVHRSAFTESETSLVGGDVTDDLVVERPRVSPHIVPRLSMSESWFSLQRATLSSPTLVAPWSWEMPPPRIGVECGGSIISGLIWFLQKLLALARRQDNIDSRA